MKKKYKKNVPNFLQLQNVMEHLFGLPLYNGPKSRVRRLGPSLQ